jgi:hypothetical protein
MQFINWQTNKALSVSGKSDTEGQAVVVENKQTTKRQCTKTKVGKQQIETCRVGPDHQSWKVVYLD